MLKIREIDAECQIVKQLNVEVITRLVPLSTIEAVVDETGVREKRMRRLPSVLVVVLVIAMNLFVVTSQHYALIRLLRASCMLLGVSVEQLGSKSGVSRARYRIGAAPLVRLFERVCQPLATNETDGAFLYGLRVMAIDGTVEPVADTPENRAAFGGSVTHKGDGAFPQIQCVHLCECGTHAIVDSVVLPYKTSELDGAQTLVRSIRAGMLVMLDQGLYRYDFLSAISQQGAHILSRIQATIAQTPAERLADGTYLTSIYPPQSKRRRDNKGLPVRVIEYTFDDPNRPGHGETHRLMTTLLDPHLYPALDLVVQYHERWEVEIAIDEMDCHQRLALAPLRSLKPEGVIQEFYGLLIAHYLVRAIMHEAALTHQLDPDQLSFLNSLRLIVDTLPYFQLTDPATHPRLWRQLLSDIAAFQLPDRDNRINPRVVKRKMSNFNRKRPEHLRPPKLQPFADTLQLLLRDAYA